MSELPRCPYCGAILWEGPAKYTEEGTKLLCGTCARSYVYIPGYGSFALYNSDSDEQLEVPVTATLPRDENLQYSKDARVAKACFTLCCLLSSVPFVLIMVIMALVSLF